MCTENISSSSLCIPEEQNCAPLNFFQRSLKSMLGSKYEKTNISDPLPHIKKWLPSSGLSAWYLSLVPKHRNSLCFCSCGGFYINKMRQGPRTCQSNLLIKALGQNVKTSASAELISVLLAYLTWEFWENTQIPFLSLPLPSLTCHRITEW